MASSISAGTTSSTALVATADTTGALQLATNNGTVAVTVDTSQNVGIGTTSPTQKLSISGGSASVTSTVNSVYAPLLLTNSSSGSSAYNLVQFGNDASVSVMQFGCLSSTNASYGGTNSALLLANSGALQMQTQGASPVVFGTNSTERMRIDSSGNVLVGTTSTSLGSIGCQMFPTGYYQATCNGAPAMILKRGSNDGAIVDFYDSGGNRRGYINVTTSATTYNTISDYRLKEDVAPMTGALAKVAALKPVTYKWKADGSYGQGFIAHELQSVVPDCVVGEKDAVNENGDPSYQGIDTSFLVATLTAAIQELTAKVTALEAKVGASA